MAGEAKERKSARLLYRELLELMRRIVTEERADEQAAKRFEYLATVRYAVPGPIPGRYTVEVSMDLNDPYVMNQPEAFEGLMDKALEIAFASDPDTAFMLIGAVRLLRADALHENDALPPDKKQTIEPWS